MYLSGNLWISRWFEYVKRNPVRRSRVEYPNRWHPRGRGRRGESYRWSEEWSGQRSIQFDWYSVHQVEAVCGVTRKGVGGRN